jgi:hypothetical protein
MCVAFAEEKPFVPDRVSSCDAVIIWLLCRSLAAPPSPDLCLSSTLKEGLS